MAKKRLIFTLLYSDGGFMLSRNFRLQRAGNIEWLKNNYNFKNIVFSIDELIIIDVSRGERDIHCFCNHIKMIVEECFIPIAAGGGITTCEQAKMIMNSGADKLIVNTALFKSPALVRDLIRLYGGQCIIASVDVKRQPDGFHIYIENGSVEVPYGFSEGIKRIMDLGVGEIYLNSMDKDGTGHGYLYELLSEIRHDVKMPIIMAGGAGNWHHLLEGLQHDNVDAVATANLFNFIGQGFPNARRHLLNNDLNLARWAPMALANLKNNLNSYERVPSKRLTTPSLKNAQSTHLALEFTDQ
jgi:cyclase